MIYLIQNNHKIEKTKTVIGLYLFHIKCKKIYILGTKYFGHHFFVTSKKDHVNQALTSSQHL
jgi:hypothetical protein